MEIGRPEKTLKKLREKYGENNENFGRLLFCFLFQIFTENFQGEKNVSRKIKISTGLEPRLEHWTWSSGPPPVSPCPPRGGVGDDEGAQVYGQHEFVAARAVALRHRNLRGFAVPFQSLTPAPLPLSVSPS